MADLQVVGRHASVKTTVYCFYGCDVDSFYRQNPDTTFSFGVPVFVDPAQVAPGSYELVLGVIDGKGQLTVLRAGSLDVEERQEPGVIPE